MPFIRYDIGDKGKLYTNGNCSCGCKGKVIELSSGRNNDYILLVDGERIGSYIFVGIFDKINAYTDGAILQFYVEQTNYEEFHIMLCKDEEVEEKSIIEIFQVYINESCLRNAKFSFVFTDELFEVRGSGKHMYFKNVMNS